MSGSCAQRKRCQRVALKVFSCKKVKSTSKRLSPLQHEIHFLLLIYQTFALPLEREEEHDQDAMLVCEQPGTASFSTSQVFKVSNA